MNDCVIRDVLVVPVTGEVPFRGWVEVRGESISAVGRGVANETGEQLII
jgi:N-acyl-D-aspartate/D-glutamate deacylase